MCRLIPFGVLDGRDIPLIELSDGRCAVELLPYGAAIRTLRVPDREGRMTDICLGYDDVESYRTLDACLGGTIGRCANRIGGAQFTIDGTTYHVTANEGENCLHGGVEGFHKKLWNFTCAEDAVTFTYTSPDGEEGFPGAVRVEVTYRLAGGTLTIEYRAAAEKDTVVNLTNHAYFNLGGHDSGEVGGHVLTVRADRYTPTDSGNVPTGTLAAVEGKPLGKLVRTGKIAVSHCHLSLPPGLKGARLGGFARHVERSLEAASGKDEAQGQSDAGSAGGKGFFHGKKEMTETEFLEEAEAEMNRLQDHIESKYEDVDCTRSGNVLTIELEDGAQAVVNIQTPMQEIWFASHLGGMHFRETDQGWINPRDGRTLEATVEGAIDALMSR